MQMTYSWEEFRLWVLTIRAIRLFVCLSFKHFSDSSAENAQHAWQPRGLFLLVRDI